MKRKLDFSSGRRGAGQPRRLLPCRPSPQKAPQRRTETIGRRSQDRRADRHVGLYSDLRGAGAVLAAKMAIDDFKAMEKGKAFPIELVSADHQNKADVGAKKAREWFDTQGST